MSGKLKKIFLFIVVTLILLISLFVLRVSLIKKANGYVNYLYAFNPKLGENYHFEINNSSGNIVFDLKEELVVIENNKGEETSFIEITDITNEYIILNDGNKLDINVFPEIHFKDKLTPTSMFTCEREFKNEPKIITTMLAAKDVNEYENVLEQTTNILTGVNEEVDLVNDWNIKYIKDNEGDILVFGNSKLSSAHYENGVNLPNFTFLGGDSCITPYRDIGYPPGKKRYYFK